MLPKITDPVLKSVAFVLSMWNSTYFIFGFSDFIRPDLEFIPINNFQPALKCSAISKPLNGRQKNISKCILGKPTKSI